VLREIPILSYFRDVSLDINSQVGGLTIPIAMIAKTMTLSNLARTVTKTGSMPALYSQRTPRTVILRLLRLLLQSPRLRLVIWQLQTCAYHKEQAHPPRTKMPLKRCSQQDPLAPQGFLPQLYRHRSQPLVLYPPALTCLQYYAPLHLSPPPPPPHVQLA
jgi:hypothetical protein